MKISESQLVMLRHLAKEGDTVTRLWGKGFGLRRASIAALAQNGLVTYDAGVPRDIACAMTQAGFDFLKALDAADPREHTPTAMDMTTLNALSLLSSEGSAEGFTHDAVGLRAGFRNFSPSETAARHLIRLSHMGLVERKGTRSYPSWFITESGKALIGETS